MKHEYSYFYGVEEELELLNYNSKLQCYKQLHEMDINFKADSVDALLNQYKPYDRYIIKRRVNVSAGQEQVKLSQLFLAFPKIMISSLMVRY